MANSPPSIQRDDDALFVKDGAPVKFCLHKSVTQGRGQITRNVERRGGKIVADEHNANVLLIDEQENLDLFRRRYYSSTELYRLSLYVEPRSFVQHCIRAGRYAHAVPFRQGMPGRAPGGGGRARVPFTEEDRDHLAYYLATRFPTRDGRFGSKAYKELEHLGQTDDESWAWAKRHTFHSWREHYKMNPQSMDARIEFYQERLKGVGHHMGYDPRTRNRLRELRVEEEGEEEEGEEGDEEGQEQQEQRQGMERQDNDRHEQDRPVTATAQQAQAARDYLERQQNFEEGEDEDMQEEEEVVLIKGPLPAKRNNNPPEARSHGNVQAKRPRISEADERYTSDVEEGRNEASPAVEETGESQEIKENDLFGDRSFERLLSNTGGFHKDDFELVRPMSPRASPVPEADGPALSTQATLIASPHLVDKEVVPNPVLNSAEAIMTQEPPYQPTHPPSSSQTVVMVQEKVVVQRPRVRGASAQPGPSKPKATRTGADVARVEAPYRNTRSRSRSVDPQAQPLTRPEHESESQRRKDPRGRRGKGKAKEVLVPIEEDMQVEEQDTSRDIGIISTNGASTVDEELVVEDLLEASTTNGIGEEDEGDEGEPAEHEESSDEEEMFKKLSQLPRTQDVNIKAESESLESDDAEIHGTLVRSAPIRDDTSQAGPKEGLSQSESDSDNDDAERIVRLSRETLHTVPTSSQPRVTRSVTATQTQETRRQTRSQTRAQSSPRQTRSGTHRTAPTRPVFPSPGTKARAVVDRFNEEERKMPYVPPVGSRAEKVVRGKGRRG